MSGSAGKCFKTDSNDFKSSNDHINKKKALAIYNSVKEQSKTNSQVKHDKTEYNGPVFVNEGGFLGAVGGYDTSNYDLKLNVAKGRAYSEMPCVVSTDLSTNAITNVVLYNPNDLCINSVSKCQIPTSTYELFEGPYLIKTTSNTYSSEDCPLKSRQQYTTYDPSNIQTRSFSKLANDNKLQNLNLNSKLSLTCQPQLPVTIFIGSLYFIDIVGDLTSDKYVSIIPKLEIKEVIIGTNVLSIGQSAFFSCSNLKAISIPNSVTTIDVSGLSLCTALTSITIPKSVTTIGPNAFESCTNLKAIKFDDIANSSLITIGNSAFNFSSDISNITLPPSLTSVGTNFISNCTDLSYIEFLGSRPDLTASYPSSMDLSGDINPVVFSNLRTAGADPSTNIIIYELDSSWNRITSIDGYPVKFHLDGFEFLCSNVPLFWNDDDVGIFNGIVLSINTNQTVSYTNSPEPVFAYITGATETLNEVLTIQNNINPSGVVGSFINSGCIINLEATSSIITEYKEKIQKYIQKEFSINISTSNIQLSPNYLTYTII